MALSDYGAFCNGFEIMIRPPRGGYSRGLGFLMSFLVFFGDFSADVGGFRPPGPRKSSPPCDFTSIGGRRAPEDDI